MTRKYVVRTFGCQMNAHDSERISGLLEQDGMEMAEHEDDAGGGVEHLLYSREC